MGVYSFVIARERLVYGMPSPIIKKMKKLYNETKLPWTVVGMEGTRGFGNHGLCLYGGGGVNFTFLLGNRL